MTEFPRWPSPKREIQPDRTERRADAEHRRAAGRHRKIALKLQQESNAELNNVTGYGRDYVEVNRERFAHSILLFPQGPVVPWPVGGFDTLSPTDFDLLAQASPELVLFGTGERLRFGHPRLFAALSAQRIGVETMDLSAACRTFNILIGEGRRAAAALLIEPG